MGYGAGSSFLMDFKMLSHVKLIKALDRDLDVVYRQV